MQICVTNIILLRFGFVVSINTGFGVGRNLSAKYVLIEFTKPNFIKSVHQNYFFPAFKTLFWGEKETSEFWEFRECYFGVENTRNKDF